MASVRHWPTAAATRRPAELAPGEIAWARIYNGIENPSADGKTKPVILIEARGTAWGTLGLTTRPHHRDGTPRVAVPHPSSVGLQRPGWLWSGKLTWTSGIDIEEHIGWADQALVFEAARLAGLDGRTIKALLVSALAHHPAPARSLRIVDGERP
jgi:hypothetical protein